MSYIIEQKIHGNIYLYRVESYWDKEKKQPRQIRVYLGPKEKKQERPFIKERIRNIITKNYGNICLFEDIATTLGIKSILQKEFPQDYREILALAWYEIMEGTASYKFPYWLEEQQLNGVRKMYSADISDLYDTLGGMQKERMGFIKSWIQKLKPIKGIYYDITSISSYSSNIDFIEWGYNRDKENLPQLNLGMTCCQEKGLPFFYTLFPGSIVDVSTIKNQLSYLESFKLKDLLLVQDRGFCSIDNIYEMHKSEMGFIQPLSFSLNKAKELIQKHGKTLHNSTTAFRYNEEIIHYVSDVVGIKNLDFDVHIYLNEKAEVDQKNLFLSRLLEAEVKFDSLKFTNIKEFEDYSNDHIPDRLKRYYQWNKITQQIERNQKAFDAYIANLGYFIFASNRNNLDKTFILNCYRNKDQIEKMYDVLKNEMDGSRLRVHSNWNMEGKLFVKFIAMIFYMRISHIMNEHKLFKKYSLREMIMELKKIKITTLDDYQIVSEISKKTKTSFRNL